MRKKQGFTIVEILAVVVILGLLGMIGTITVTNIINRAHLAYYQSQENMILLAGKEYYSDYRSKLPKEIGPVETVTLGTLIQEKYLDEQVVDYRKKACNNDESGVKVQKQGEEIYSYSVFLKCDNYDGYEKGNNPSIQFLPNSKKSNKEIQVEMRIRDNQEVKYYSYVVYQDEVIVKTVEKQAYNQVIKILLQEEGTYKIIGTAWDNEDNVTIKESGTYLIDRTGPDCSAVKISASQPSGKWTYQNIDLTFTFPSEVISWDWATNVDNGRYYIKSSNRVSTTKKTLSSEGRRRGRLTIYDAVGNSCKLTTEEYLIDKTQPKVTLTGSVTSGVLTNKDVTLTGTPTPSSTRSGYTYLFEKNGNNGWEAAGEWQTSNQYKVTTDGRNNYRVKVKTGAGKEATSSQTHEVNIDKTPPDCSTIQFSPNGANVWMNKNVNVTVSPNNSDIDTYDVLKKINTGAFTTYAYAKRGNYTFSISDGGTVQLQAKAYDKAGNFCTVNSGNYLIDSLPPSVPSATVWYDYVNGPVRGNTAAWTNRNLAWGNFSATDQGTGVDHYEYSANCTGQKSGNLGGSYTYSTTQPAYCIRAVDKAGNASGWSSPYYFNIDKTPPTCQSQGGNAKWVKSLTLTGICSDTGGSGCKGNIVRNITTTLNSNAESPGSVTDYAGNVGPCPANQQVHVDATPPTCTIKDITESGTYKDGLDYRITCSDTGGSGLSTCDGLSNKTKNEYLNQHPNADTKKRTYYAYDAVGNKGSCSITIQRQWRSASCKTCKACNKASCKTRQACVCNGWTTTCCYSCSANLGWHGENICNTTCKTPSKTHCGLLSQTSTCTGGYSRSSSCACQTYNTNCAKCGCSKYNSWSAWADNKRCSASNLENKKCKEEARWRKG